MAGHDCLARDKEPAAGNITKVKPAGIGKDSLLATTGNKETVGKEMDVRCA